MKMVRPCLRLVVWDINIKRFSGPADSSLELIERFSHSLASYFYQYYNVMKHSIPFVEFQTL